MHLVQFLNISNRNFRSMLSSLVDERDLLYNDKNIKNHDNTFSVTTL